MEGNILAYSLTVFTAFFAIMNPIINIPIFIKLTEGQNQKKKEEIAKTATLVAFIIIVSFILIGKYIFQVFGLTIPAFKIFGGVLISYIGFGMLQSNKTGVHLLKDTVYDDGVTISPLAIPILAGPGDIVTAMNFVVNVKFLHLMIVISILALLIFSTYLAFVYSNYIVRILGDKNIVIISKVMGIILGVFGVNMLIEGIKIAFNIK
jgi:multiple antibiotic resistance protein